MLSELCVYLLTHFEIQEIQDTGTKKFAYALFILNTKKRSPFLDSLPSSTGNKYDSTAI